MKTSILLLAVMAACTAVAQTPLSSGKKSNVNNPLNAFNYCADPTAVVFDGRVYVYGTNDHQEFSAYSTPFSESNSYGKINSLVCMSSSDMVNWTWHAPIDVKKIAPWTGCSWAPSICSKTDSDGKTHFYLYFANGASGIGVITADSPTGPWKDPLGKALVAPGQDKLGGIVWLFDPGVCVDDNGVGWLAYGGGGEPNSVGNDLIDGNTRIAKLTDDMVHFDGDPIVLPAPFHFEASELNYIGGKYVYSYCANWGPKRELWKDFNNYDHSKTKPEAPYAAQMCYMVSTDPLNAESWQYVGNYLDHPGGNNHTHLQKFGSSYYLFHHSEMLSRAINNGDGKGYRSILANKIEVDEKKCEIKKLDRSSIDNGLSMIRNNRPIITDLQQAEMMWNAAGIGITITGRGNSVVAVNAKEPGCWVAVRLAYTSSEVASLKARLRGKGKMEIRLDDVNAAPVGTVDFDSSSFKDYTILLDQAFKGAHTIYFFFKELAAGKNNDFDEWQFFTEDATAIYSADVNENVVNVEYYNLKGEKCDAPKLQGIYIKKIRLDNGKTIAEKIAY